MENSEYKVNNTQRNMARVVALALAIALVAMTIISILSTSGGFGVISIREGIWRGVFDGLWLYITACTFFLLGMLFTKVSDEKDQTNIRRG